MPLEDHRKARDRSDPRPAHQALMTVGTSESRRRDAAVRHRSKAMGQPHESRHPQRRRAGNAPRAADRFFAAAPGSAPDHSV